MPAITVRIVCVPFAKNTKIKIYTTVILPVVSYGVKLGL
jgi:hypothetical protein